MQPDPWRRRREAARFRYEIVIREKVYPECAEAVGPDPLPRKMSRAGRPAGSVVWQSVDVRKQRSRWSMRGALAAAAPPLFVVGANACLRMVSAGRRFTVSTVPRAPVVIVPGARIGPDGLPMTYLRGRLDIAIELLAAHKAGEVLISGDAQGHSGDEIASMRRYLVEHGVCPDLIRADPEGLSTRATCERAHDLFGIDRAIIVTQNQHAPRAISRLRVTGIDANSVDPYCEYTPRTLVRNTVREWLAAPKAVAALISSTRRRGTAPRRVLRAETVTPGRRGLGIPTV